jgi:IrrE N-terminal-like domain
MTTGTTGSRRAQIDQLVTAMMAHLTADGIDLDELAGDPSAVIATVDDLVFQWVNTDTIGGGCSVAALYSGAEHPPRISVARDASAGRRAFSALHEFGHHLCRRATTVSDALFELPDGGHSIEEDLVDAFAAAVLLPQHTVTTGFADGVDAAAVIQLWRSTAASREACCVAAAQHLPAPGYVMLLQWDGHCQFAARNGDVFPIARNSLQTAARLQPALRGGTARGVDRPNLGSGIGSAEMHFDARADERYVFAVWLTDSPAWDALPVPLDAAPAGHDGYCEACAQEFTSWKAKCQQCSEPRCPRCGACSCEHGAQSRTTTRFCQRCFCLLPLQAFDGDSTICNEH